jgi:ferric-dicitrate binding protein FerR (iron transport regulator)
MTPVMTRAQRSTISGPHTLRRRRWINALGMLLAAGAAVAAAVVGCS